LQLALLNLIASSSTDINMVVNLCNKCQIVIKEWAVLDRSTEVDEVKIKLPSEHHTKSALIASADDGCQLCSLFLAGLSKREMQRLRKDLHCEKPAIIYSEKNASSHDFDYLTWQSDQMWNSELRLKLAEKHGKLLSFVSYKQVANFQRLF
jgi:hypothetical protein